MKRGVIEKSIAKFVIADGPALRLFGWDASNFGQLRAKIVTNGSRSLFQQICCLESASLDGGGQFAARFTIRGGVQNAAGDLCATLYGVVKRVK